MRGLVTVRGSGSGTGGVLSLYSESFYVGAAITYSYIRLGDPGVKVKIWTKRVAADGAAWINIEYTNDITASTVTWTTIESQYLASPGVIELEKRRPIVINARTGREAVRITWSSATSVTVSVEVEIEITDEDE